MSPQIRPLEREFRSGRTPNPVALTAALRNLPSSRQHPTIIVVPGDWVGDIASQVRGTGILTAAALTSTGADLLRNGRRCIATGADELEVPWSEVSLATQAFGDAVPITTELPPITGFDVVEGLRRAADLGVEMVHVSGQQLANLPDLPAAGLAIELGLRSEATSADARKLIVAQARDANALTRISLPLP